ncbi:MAG: hypothetical protein ABL993_02620 [Vicinamibacterales bacterium]
MRPIVLAMLLLALGCADSPTEPDPCAPDEHGYGCDPLPPPVSDTLIPLPDPGAH